MIMKVFILFEHCDDFGSSYSTVLAVYADKAKAEKENKKKRKEIRKKTRNQEYCPYEYTVRECEVIE